MFATQYADSRHARENKVQEGNKAGRARRSNRQGEVHDTQVLFKRDRFSYALIYLASAEWRPASGSATRASVAATVCHTEPGREPVRGRPLADVSYCRINPDDLDGDGSHPVDDLLTAGSW
jgi:hypothetical protein